MTLQMQTVMELRYLQGSTNMSNRGDFGTPLCVLISATLITEEWDAKHNPQEPIPSQGFPLLSAF